MLSMRFLDPDGVERRKQHRFKRRKYYAKVRSKDTL